MQHWRLWVAINYYSWWILTWTAYYRIAVTSKQVTRYLRTIGEGIQNLLKVFLMFSCKVVSSRHHVVGSAADGPAVGSVLCTIHAQYFMAKLSSQYSQCEKCCSVLSTHHRLNNIALHVHISELRVVTCHMGSHSVTCHPTQVNAPHLTPAREAGTSLTYPGGMVGWVDLGG